MLIRKQLLMALASITLGVSSFAGQFYLFPLHEIEGLETANSKVARPLIDQKLTQRFFMDEEGKAVQKGFISTFTTELNKTYPNSVIHPKQVYDTKIPGPYKFINNDNQECKPTPSYFVNDTYAVVLGLTRASLYEVERGGNIEVLIPITLNLQFVQPHLGKIVFTTSETVYSPFRFTKEEYRSGSKDGVIRGVLAKNISEQITSLMKVAKVGFNPQEVPIKIIGKEGKFYITYKGFEFGFSKGEQVDAHGNNEQENIFTVNYADSGFAVLTLDYGKADVGDSLKFVFEKPADDSRKPRVMPVVSESSVTVNAISDVFSKDIGFKASFQISAVDVNFAQTKQLIKGEANCVTWQKIPSMTDASGERKDPPDFFLKFNAAKSPITTLAGAGGTKTSERFHTIVTAQVVDHSGKVIYSEIGDDDYSLDKVNGQGLNLEQAKEISLKNATLKMSRNVVANIKIQPKDFYIAKVDKDYIWVEGIGNISTTDKPVFTVLHPLSTKANGKTSYVDLDIGEGVANLVVDAGLVGLPISITRSDLPKPVRGDIVRISSPITAPATPILECAAPTFIAPNTVAEAPYFEPLIKHAMYRSTKYSTHINDDTFYSDTNYLLTQGMFDLQIKKENSEMCFLPGYMIREVSSKCDDPLSCKATLTTGALVRLMKGADVTKSVSTVIQTDLSGFPDQSKKDFYGYKQLSNGITLMNDLTNKLNIN